MQEQVLHARLWGGGVFLTREHSKLPERIHVLPTPEEKLRFYIITDRQQNCFPSQLSETKGSPPPLLRGKNYACADQYFRKGKVLVLTGTIQHAVLR